MMQIARQIGAEKPGSAPNVVPVIQPVKAYTTWLYSQPHGTITLADY